MAALTFNTRYDTKRRKRVATGDSASPATATTVAPGKKLLTFVLIAAAVVIGYKYLVK